MAGDMEDSLYDLLGVEPVATTAEIRQAFRKLALTHHPDRGGDEETFTKISKAYETLSDPKSRARYDTTGRTAGLTAEEELREAFFGGGLGSKSNSTDDRQRSAGNMSSEERAKRETAEAERLEAKRRLDESERRDAERRAKLAGGQGAATSAASNGPPPSAVPLAGQNFATGDRVELVDLKKSPDLMGLTGLLIGSRDGRWQVRLDNGKGDKLIKVNNLKKLSPTGTQGSSQAKATSTSASSYSIVASWTKWTPQGMTWDGNRRCFVSQFELGSSAIESFQILAGRDFSACVHPDQLDANPHTQHRLCGPDDRGHGYNWTIGRHANDKSLAGSRVEVRLMLSPDGKLDRVEWGRKDDLRPATKASNGQTMAKGKAASRDNKVSAANVAVPMAAEIVKTPMPPMPEQQYMVVHEQVFVRKDPSLTAEALGILDRGQYIGASEETLDGWLRLESDDRSIGWALKDMRGKRGLGQLVAPYGREMQLPISEIAESPGPHKFRVVFKPKVVVRDAPSKTAKMIALKQFGAEVMVLTQTYTGWVRLANDEGWMLLSDPELGELLAPVYVEEEKNANNAVQSAETKLKEAIVKGDLNQLQEAMKKAKGVKVSDSIIKDAEAKLVALHQEQGKRTEMRQRIDAAARNETQLRECIDECMKRSPPWEQEFLYAQKLIEQLQSEQEQTAKENKVHLDDLYQATLSGDLQIIKRARDSAKKAGVPMKEIARVYALAQAAAASAAESVVQERVETEVKVQSEVTATQEEVPSVCPPEEPETSPYPPEVAKAAVAAAWGLAPEEASQPDLNSVEPEKGSPLDNTIFDGSWCSQETGKLAATISGLKLVTPDGEIQARRHCERGIAFEMSDETFQAEMDDAGQLVWSDGDVWVRNVPTSPEVSPPPPSVNLQETPAVPDEAPISVFDGYWIGQEDDHMATIKGLTIHWADGPAQELEILAEDTIKCELFGHEVSAKLDPEGRLVWNDGDIWIRIAEPDE